MSWICLVRMDGSPAKSIRDVEKKEKHEVKGVGGVQKLGKYRARVGRGYRGEARARVLRER